ncbi:ribosome biogenesis protein bop1-like [Styela clava]|uniref:ribosome biogenesis protein bop1-like n=1 Tax=Styela clava TaxID=7725 RepID=UPI001939E453|nr:ribosome biogenesis protein bop1-like [Styela clava]
MRKSIEKRKLDDDSNKILDTNIKIEESSEDELSENESDFDLSSEDSGVDEDYLKLSDERNQDQEKTESSSIIKRVTPSSDVTDANNDDNDTSDEEDIRNTVGNIPMKWYENFPHIGYDLDGKQISKPIRNMDELDKFLDKMDNPDYWKTVYDENTARDHKLTEDELQLVSRLKTGKFYNSTIDPYEPYVDFFTHEKMIHPINNAPAHKRSFTPSHHEKLKVGKLVHAIKMGWLKPRKEKKEDEQPVFFDLWADSKDENLSHSQIARRKMHIPAPKVKLPGHEASYNPPPEYLMSEEERLAWEQEDPEDRKTNFVPQKYDCLRKVPQYPKFIQDAFARCLDLYLCPRQRKMRVNVDPEDLIPKLPKPSDLQPFPTVQALCYRGHENIIRSISVHQSGQWIASGSDDKTIRVWEVSSGRCVRIIHTDDVVKCVVWCPNASVCLLAAVIANSVVIINPYVGDRLICQASDQLINSYEEPSQEDTEIGNENAASSQLIPWRIVEPGEEFKNGFRIVLDHGKAVSKVTWHGKGDYFATVLPGNGHMQVLLHQLTKRRSQNPFSKCKGLVQCVLFHPNRPFLFVASQTIIRVYNLIKQTLSKKLIANAKWISSISVHPKGDDILVGSYDGRLMWFDMDLSMKPYQTLRYHKRAIRSCCYHKRYPLFASCSDDGSVIVSHGMVYSDLLQNPLIVPVKVLKGHRVERNLGVLDCCFHPSQPWIFSSAADNTIRLFS